MAVVKKVEQKNGEVVLLGPVVEKPVNVNPGLKFNRLLYFVYVLFDNLS